MPFVGWIEYSLEYHHGYFDPTSEFVVVLLLLYGDGTVPAVVFLGGLVVPHGSRLLAGRAIAVAALYPFQFFLTRHCQVHHCEINQEPEIASMTTYFPTGLI